MKWDTNGTLGGNSLGSPSWCEGL